MGEIADRLKALRKNAKLTQAQVASESDQFQSVISDIEKGDRKPDINLLSWYSKRFNCSLDWILTGNGEQSVRKDPVRWESIPADQEDRRLTVLIQEMRSAYGDKQSDVEKLDFMSRMLKLFAEEKK